MFHETEVSSKPHASDVHYELHDMKCDVTIIGSGIAGMTAAAILARKGKKVIIVF